MVDHPLLIAGGGIAGLAAALSLARQGQEVLVLEREADFSEAGAGLQLGPNAVAALRAIGVWDAVEAITAQPPEIHLRDGRSGELLKRLPLTGAFERRFGAPYRVALRADLHEALLAHCRVTANIRLQTGYDVREVQQSISDVTVNHTLQGCCLLAADGVHSIQRQKLFPGSAAVDSGFVFHRALQTVAPVPGMDLDCVTLWLLPGGHVVHYPAGRARRLNVVCVTNRLSSPQATAALSCSTLAQLLNQLQWTRWPGFFVSPLNEWHNGRIALIGDAAHGTLPFLAQGAAMALEDAASLSLIDGSCRFPESRLARTAQLHRKTLAAGRRYHLSRPFAVARNIALRMLPGTILMSQLSWLYRQEDGSDS
jgi:2-polyprenyl-6-methoxyphenol hydroxylase-like FAD-dependent oxidoreductase